MSRLPRGIGGEAASFLVVGGLAYAVDVGAFNVLWGTAPFDHWQPAWAKAVAVALAMVVTYVGNQAVTWRGRTAASPRQVAAFLVANGIGLGISVVCLWVSHDLLGLTSRLEDNLSANVVGVGLGTAFRWWSYRTVVFARTSRTRRPRTEVLRWPQSTPTRSGAARVADER